VHVHRLRDGNRRSRRAALNYWLLVRGRGDNPLPAEVHAREIRAHSSSKRPSVEPGDLAVLYAAVWQAVFAIAEIVGEPEHDPERERWSWRFPIRPLAAVADLHDAPAVEEIGVFPKSIWRHSHIRLTPEQFQQAGELIRIARREGRRRWARDDGRGDRADRAAGR
jgi:hypothetical protein